MKILLGNNNYNKNYKNLKVEKDKIYLEKNDGENLLAIFPTRSGFTTRIAIPTVLNHQGNMVVFDLQNEIYEKTHIGKEKENFTICRVDLDEIYKNVEKTKFYSEKVEETLKKSKFIIYVVANDLKKFDGILSKSKMVDFVLEKVRDSEKKCFTIFEECGAFVENNPKILPYITNNKNNQFLLKFQSITQANLYIKDKYDILEKINNIYIFVKDGIKETVVL